jgi:hypothetical protein
MVVAEHCVDAVCRSGVAVKGVDSNATGSHTLFVPLKKRVAVSTATSDAPLPIVAEPIYDVFLTRNAHPSLGRVWTVDVEFKFDLGQVDDGLRRVEASPHVSKVYTARTSAKHLPYGPKQNPGRLNGLFL